MTEVTIKKLANAIDTIAEYLNEPMMKFDKETGEEYEVNGLEFIQKRILNGIAYSASKTLEYSVKTQDEAAKRLRQAIRSHTGDEISEGKLNSAIDWKERIDLQVSTLDALREQAIKAYADHTGETFSDKPRTGKALPAREFQTDAMKRAASLLGEDVGEGNRGGGVEVAESEAA